jgi:hypothetical protein
MSEELAEYGGKSPAEARRRGGEDAMPCRVRHARTGLYLEVKGRVMPATESPRDLALRWRLGPAAGTAMPRAMAARTAAAYIVLTDDHGVEIEATTNQE